VPKRQGYTGYVGRSNSRRRGKSFGVERSGRKGKGNAKEKVGLDLDEIAGGKVELSKDASSLAHSFKSEFMVLLQDADTLIIQLLLSHHLKEYFHSTAYSINVYLLSGPQAMCLTRLSREAVEGGSGQRIECTFLKKTGWKAGKSKRKDSGTQAKSSKGSGISDSRWAQHLS
jgi:ATP-dependent DNA helicase Q1